MPLSLPQRLYLLSYTPEKGKFEVNNLQFRGQKLRAGALAELVVGGFLTIEPGKHPKVVRAKATPPADDFLAEVRDDASPQKPTPWLNLVHPHAHTAESAVRAQLAASGEITLPDITGIKKLSPLAQHGVTVHHPEQATALREEARDPVLRELDPASLPLDTLALTAIAAENDLHHVFDRGDRRTHKKQLKAVAAQFDTAFPGLRLALLSSITLLRAAGGGWGK